MRLQLGKVPLRPSPTPRRSAKAPDNQQVFGTSTNTYTMPGITSAASKTAQGAATAIVTTNASGDLAAYTAAQLGLATSGDVAGINTQITNINGQIAAINGQIAGLGRRDKELAGGIAIASALATPTLLTGQTFAMRGGWGNFDGSNALSFSAAGLVSRGYAGPTSSLVLDVGVGRSADTNMTTGRAGVTVGW
jgi:trimeric autotransporter adhesin